MFLELVVIACSILVILLVHEIGHLVAARYCGVRVMSVSIGFGPEVIGVTDRFGTRWTLAVLPVGACLKMSDDPNGLALRPPLVAADSLSSKSIGQRAAIYAGGPAFSLILAVGIYGSSLALFGELVLPGSYYAKPEVIIASLLGGFSLLVGLFNLIPIPPLDGGSLALLAIEAMAGKPVSKCNQQILCTAGLALITIVSASIAIFAIHRTMTNLTF